MATHSSPDPQDQLISLTTAVDNDTEVDQDVIPPPTVNRRAHPRRVVAQLAWLDNVRVKYGPEVTLLDLSPGGAQVETAGYPLQPGSAIVLEIRAAGKMTTIPAQVVRCQLASLSPIPTYRGAVRFKRAFDFPEGIIAGDAETEWDPTIEYERLNVMLNRMPQPGGAPSSLSSGALTPNGAQSLDAAFSMIEAPPGGADWSPFAREMGKLFQAAARAVEKASAVDEIVIEVIERLRRSIPTLAVRLVEQGGSERRQDEIVCFQVPTEGGKVVKLLVEFAKDCPLEQWHLQLLQGAALIIGALRTFAPVS